MWESAAKEFCPEDWQDPFSMAQSFLKPLPLFLLICLWLDVVTNAAIFTILFALILWRGDFMDFYGEIATLWIQSTGP